RPSTTLRTAFLPRRYEARNSVRAHREEPLRLAFGQAKRSALGHSRNGPGKARYKGSEKIANDGKEARKRSGGSQNSVVVPALRPRRRRLGRGRKTRPRSQGTTETYQRRARTRAPRVAHRPWLEGAS